MGPITSIAAGFAVALGAVALYQAMGRRFRAAKKAVDDLYASKEVIDFELDQKTGVYRCK